MDKIGSVINEIKKVNRFKGHIIFFMMDKYGFILDKDVKKLKKLKNVELEYEEGTLHGYPALRYKVFDPNNYEPFNSIIKADGKPASVTVQPEYRVEEDFIKK